MNLNEMIELLNAKDKEPTPEEKEAAWEYIKESERVGASILESHSVQEVAAFLSAVETGIQMGFLQSGDLALLQETISHPETLNFLAENIVKFTLGIAAMEEWR